METLVVYLDDTAYAHPRIAPMLANKAPTNLVLVMVPPRLGRHATRWVSAQHVQSWRMQWVNEHLAPLSVRLQAEGHQVTWRCARQPLVRYTAQLQNELGLCRVLDVRRPKLLVTQEPVTPNQPTNTQGRWAIPSSLIAAGSLVALAAE